MKESILVGYASRYGSTREVAEAVAAILSEQGLDVDLQPLRKVASLERYRAVVLGAPLFVGRWHKDARSFLARHREALAELPAALFTLGPLKKDEKDWAEVKAQLDKELAKIPWFKPLATELFGGKYDPAKLRFPLKLLVTMPPSPLHHMPASDARDWEKIRAWAAGLARQLRPNKSR
jgi:menaquinone-dependent protoporphyrinogen oxidase